MYNDDAPKSVGVGAASMRIPDPMHDRTRSHSAVRPPRRVAFTPEAARALAWIVASVLPVIHACDRAPARPPDVLLLSVDTLRADALGCYGRAEARTPRLDRLAAEGVRFEHAFSPRGATLPSLTTLLTGVSPLRHGVLSNGFSMARGLTTLAETFATHGYRTAAFITNQCAPLVRRDDHAARGFDERVCTEDDSVPQHVWDTRATDAAIAWLDAAPPDQPVLVWVHLMDPHAPHEPPPERVHGRVDPRLVEGQSEFMQGFVAERSRPDAAVLTDLWRLYDAEIEGVDANAARLLDAIARRGEYDGVVVFTADHGEELFEHGAMYGHDDSIYDAVLHVPLVLRAPGRLPAGTVVPRLANLQDVLPTICALAGLAPPDGLEGTSLLSRIPREGSTADATAATGTDLALGCWRRDILTARTPRWRYVWNRKPGDTEALGKDFFAPGRFRETRRELPHFQREELLFETAKDPREAIDLLAGTSPQETAGAAGGSSDGTAATADAAAIELRRARDALRLVLTRWMERHRDLEAETAPLLDAEVVDELRALGYVDDGGG